MAQSPKAEFEAIYQGAHIPWDIGEPQPALAELVNAGWCVGVVLDAGCGTGELGLAVARRGHTVTGLDVSPRAIELARRKAAERDLEARFEATDITELTGYDDAFDTVVDSGLLHVLDPTAQERYLGVLRRVCRPGGRVAVLCFADVPGARTPGGRGLTEARLRELFTDGWEIEAFERAGVLGIIPEGLGEQSEWPKDDRGRTPMTGWRLRARRRKTD
ncbi:class I SAM-dependent methyltransferase [Amycolatopsis sp. K13G38]|uniref:Class I SAM-dependent methyltransferase n=1 Tax=Amycolatopsis acididurans TaxID=2724524 RepID=A0ABX1JDK8_9PSEU|nr:class I SAM-dependent methyltransferase [Amycolatopsis acididurans]NKQ57828.1 class I SAM-dependent methyltransferase [Amycolatopsis acididurans]